MTEFTAMKNDLTDLIATFATRQAQNELPDGSVDEIVDRAHQIIKNLKNSN